MKNLELELPMNMNVPLFQTDAIINMSQKTLNFRLTPTKDGVNITLRLPPHFTHTIECGLSSLELDVIRTSNDPSRKKKMNLRLGPASGSLTSCARFLAPLLKPLHEKKNDEEREKDIEVQRGEDEIPEGRILASSEQTRNRDRSCAVSVASSFSSTHTSPRKKKVAGFEDDDEEGGEEEFSLLWDDLNVTSSSQFRQPSSSQEFHDYESVSRCEISLTSDDDEASLRLKLKRLFMSLDAIDLFRWFLTLIEEREEEQRFDLTVDLMKLFEEFFRESKFSFSTSFAISVTRIQNILKLGLRHDDDALLKFSMHLSVADCLHRWSRAMSKIEKWPKSGGGSDADKK